MYLDETKLKLTELKAIAVGLGMSSALRLDKKAMARAIEKYISSRP